MCILATDHGFGHAERGVQMLRREGLLPSVNGGLAFPVTYPDKPPRIAAINKKA